MGCDAHVGEVISPCVGKRGRSQEMEYKCLDQIVSGTQGGTQGQCPQGLDMITMMRLTKYTKEACVVDVSLNTLLFIKVLIAK